MPYLNPRTFLRQCGCIPRVGVQFYWGLIFIFEISQNGAAQLPQHGLRGHLQVGEPAAYWGGRRMMFIWDKPWE